MKFTSMLAAAFGALLSAVPIMAQQPSALSPPPLPRGASLEDVGKSFPPVGPLEKIADNLYRVVGQGGNTAVWVYSTGVLIVDTKFPKNGQKLIELVRTVTDKPITHIVNTHLHVDHTGSNAEFPGVEIVAQENTAAAMQKSPFFQTEQSKAGLPKRTFKDHLTLFAGKDAVDLYYFGRAHTDGDTIVVFRNARVMHAGDVIKKKELPAPDVGSGGSGVQFSATVAKAVAIKNVDQVIGGHSDQLISWRDFKRYADLTHSLLEHEQAAFKAGKSAEQTLADFDPSHQFDDFARAGSSFGGVAAVQATFDELARSSGR